MDHNRQVMQAAPTKYWKLTFYILLYSLESLSRLFVLGESCFDVGLVDVVV